MKQSRSDMHARSEVVATKLYEAAGVETAALRLVDVGDGRLGTASEIIEGEMDLDARMLEPEYQRKLWAGFAADAWLANWDVTGTAYDNVLTNESGDPVRVDPGGALLFRARGEAKGEAFGDRVEELKTMRDPSLNPQAARVFGGITDEALAESAARVVAITDAQIDEAVDAARMPEPHATRLKDRLKDRRDDLEARVTPPPETPALKTPATAKEVLAPVDAVEVEEKSAPAPTASRRIPMEFKEAPLSEVEAYIADDDFYFQQKVDGVRAQLVLDPGVKPWFRSKSGGKLVSSTAAKIADPLLRQLGDGLPVGSTPITVDGEMLDGKWYIFDMTVGDNDTRPWAERMGVAEDWAAGVRGRGGTDIIVALPTARTAEEKRALFEAVRDSGGEGVMIKRRDARYRFGVRTDEILKAKITSSADTVVMDVNVDGKTNAVLGVYRDGKLERVANVPTQGKGEFKVGDVVEVEYLYAHPDSKLLTQARIKRKRPDKDPLMVTDSQFRYVSKKVHDEAALAPTPDAPPPAPPSVDSARQSTKADRSDIHINGTDSVPPSIDTNVTPSLRKIEPNRYEYVDPSGRTMKLTTAQSLAAVTFAWNSEWPVGEGQWAVFKHSSVEAAEKKIRSLRSQGWTHMRTPVLLSADDSVVPETPAPAAPAATVPRNKRDPMPYVTRPFDPTADVDRSSITEAQRTSTAFTASRWRTIKSKADESPEYRRKLDVAADRLRELAKLPTFVAVPPDRIESLLQDGRWRTVFERAPSTGGGDGGGGTSTGYIRLRRDYENNVAGIGAGRAVSPAQRPVYGYLGPAPGLSGSSPADGGEPSTMVDIYGEVHFKLKDSLRGRTTMTFGDSLNRMLPPARLEGRDSMEDMDGLSMVKHGMPDIGRMVQGKPDKFDPNGEYHLEYVEAQIHGGASLEDVDRVFVTVKRLRDRLHSMDSDDIRRTRALDPRIAHLRLGEAARLRQKIELIDRATADMRARGLDVITDESPEYEAAVRSLRPEAAPIPEPEPQAPSWETPEAQGELRSMRAEAERVKELEDVYSQWAERRGVARRAAYSEEMRRLRTRQAFDEYKAAYEALRARSEEWKSKYDVDWPADTVFPDATPNPPAVSARSGDIDERTWRKIRDRYVVDDAQTIRHNSSLRSSEPSSAAKRWRSDVSRMIRSQRTTTEGTAFRVAAFTPDMASKLKPGAVLTDPGFMSVGEDEAASYPYADARLRQNPGSQAYHFRITIPEGTPIASVDFGELVLDYGTSLKITEVGVDSQGRRMISAVVVPKEKR